MPKKKKKKKKCRLSFQISDFRSAPSRLLLSELLSELGGTMYSGGYTAEVTSLSPKATENDVYDFFSHCGAVDHVEILRSGDYACTAYVTFRDAFALETAILLSGAEILDQCVFIGRWGTYTDESYNWNNPSQMTDNNTSPMVAEIMHSAYTPGEAVTVAQQVVKTMLSKGYVLTKDALVKAKAFDDSCQVSASAAAKVSELSNRIGLTDAIHTGMETVKYIDEKYHVSDITRSTAMVTGTAAVVAMGVAGKAAMAAGTAVVNSSYFSKGALWVSDMLSRASKAAAEVGTRNSKGITKL
ncbi:binding partner of ACD11 1-like isoform X1 [Cucurbita moschata]|uniref:Binding partner of ACD11 1-like isoform X1 n=1 Tax=Cucurbita moschata TaxID=3662 RepID=A0A6J1GLU2_CUCMO|nr:binding partner of ACD11 1-like isoform X1 [Cucurbita moschata]